MAIAYPEVLDIRRTVEISWNERDIKIYAIGVGAGKDPLDREGLRLVTETCLATLPTMAAALAVSATPAPLTGLNYLKAVHGGQALRMHRPLPIAGTAIATSRVEAVQDKGVGRGAVLLFETLLADKATGEAIATLHSTAFARADGGFGGPDLPLPRPHAQPDGPADRCVVVQTRRDQALLYRLSGDYNPLHADPAVARAAGFDAPILHGLCTYGIAARTVMDVYGDRDPARIVAHEARFSAPTFPGDILHVDMWRDGPVVSFTVRVPARDAIVIRNGRTELGS